MNFIRTYDCTIINWDQISHFAYEQNEKTDKIYSHIYLKNGERHDFFDAPDFFGLRNQKEYYFDETCHSEYSMIYVKKIEEFFRSGGILFDISECEEKMTLWDNFEHWANENPDKIYVRIQI